MVTALAARDGAELTLPGICGSCADVLLVGGVTIVLMARDDEPVAAYASDVAFERLEEVQFGVGAGPAFDAYRRGAPVVETDLLDHPPQRWGRLAGVVVAAGFAALHSFPLQLGAARLGALTLYCGPAERIPANRYADALVMAGAVTRAVLDMQVGLSDGQLAVELSDGDVDHAEVHQATGMVSAQLGVGIGEALVRLRARAVTDGTTIRLVAAEVVARRIRFEA